MKIALDAMGGDKAPLETVKGAVQAAQTYGVEITLVGPAATIERELKKYGAHPRGISIVPAGEAIDMEEDEIVKAVRSRRDASINVAHHLVRDGEADAVVSAGNTGAVMASAITVLGRIRGIERPAVATLLPYNEGRVLLLDIGANPECKPSYLVQFAQMGSVYMEKVVGVRNPRVALLNIGEEAVKGNDLTKEAYERLSDANVNFTGNIEGVEIHKGKAEVVVTDGFTGNIALKVGEGLADYILEQVRAVIKSSPLFIAASLLMRPALRRALKRLQYEEYGGAYLLGVNGVVVIAHGRADASAITNAVRVAKIAAESGLIETLRESLARHHATAEAAAT
ncbi:MAG TPA: phosphate acyltransferase PlsX [Dehalococcoidia bacterium]|nr:phosphate acyltransferase PlsX [Dehalococcoidia bacterium]